MKKNLLFVLFVLFLLVQSFSNITLNKPANNAIIKEYPIAFEWTAHEDEKPYTYSIYIGDSSENMHLLVNNITNENRTIYKLAGYKSQRLFWKVLKVYTDGNIAESNVSSFFFDWNMIVGREDASISIVNDLSLISPVKNKIVTNNEVILSWLDYSDEKDGCDYSVHIAFDSENWITVEEKIKDEMYLLNLSDFAIYLKPYIYWKATAHNPETEEKRDSETQRFHFMENLSPKKQNSCVIGRLVDKYNNPLRSVRLDLYRNSINIDQSYSNNDGIFSFEVEPNQSYEIKINDKRYIQVIYENIVNSNVLESYLSTIELIDSKDADKKGDKSGSIIDATDGIPLKNIEIYLRQGLNNLEGEPLLVTNTDVNGKYNIESVPYGNYTVEVKNEGYISTFIPITIHDNPEEENIALSPNLKGGELRIIVDWKEFPKDLDAHLSAYLDNGEVMHMYYKFSEMRNGSPWQDSVTLDIDNTDGMMGPETITLKNVRSGVYRFSVHNYSERFNGDSVSLSNSNVMIRILKDNKEIMHITAPYSMPGNVWNAFEMVVDEDKHGEILLTNKISSDYMSIWNYEKLIGKVVDSMSGNGLEDVIVKVIDSFIDEVLFETRSSENGEFIVPNILEDGLIIQLIKHDYEKALINLNERVQVEKVDYLSDILLINKKNVGVGQVSGKILNSIVQDLGVDFATVNIRKDFSNESGEIMKTLETDQNGNFMIESLESGQYTIELLKDDFYTNYLNFTCIGGQKNIVSGEMTPKISAEMGKEVLIILTWGSSPSDLDSHLTGPYNGSSFHLYYPHSNGKSPWPNICELDVDDTSSYGPETMTLKNYQPGTYKFFVHDYSNKDNSNSFSLTNSDAAVKIINKGKIVNVYHIPTQKKGTVWHVFNLIKHPDGSVFVQLVNEFYNQDDPERIR